ncbi:MAG: GTPase [Clostridia bacterium]|nr:GTPase [Clostridia bacterium]
MNIPVFLFTGFLESGKTKFLQETLEDKRFHKNERTLVLVCEEGIEEFDTSKIPTKNILFETIDEESDLSEERLADLAKKIKATRVMIEYNGMWQLQNLYDAMPEGWMIYQQFVFVDSTTFESYNANIRSLVVDKIQDGDVVVFNRMPLGAEQMPLHQAVRALNRNCEIAYEYVNGKVIYDDIVDPLPFDIDAPVIDIADNDYALWYRDCTEEMMKYDGKTIKFKGLVATNKNFDNKTFAAGRHIMTCCVEDITYSGVICKADKPISFKAGDWIYLTAKINIEYNKMYKGNGPVLKVISASKTTPPDQPVATF